MEPSNPYTAPVTHGVPPAPADLMLPEEITKPIRNGWVAACVSGALTLLFATLAANGKALPGMSSMMFIDVVLILGLGFGIYRKSRVCAVLMLVYFIASKILMLMQGFNLVNIAFGVAFCIVYFQAARATFAYHAHLRAPA